jgi:hypothetical protein
MGPPFHERVRDRLIVGIVGGSLAREFARDGTERLAQELRRSPLFAGREIVFVRLAVNGYKQPQQFITLSYLLSLGAEFDVLINVDGFNEVSLHESENAPRGSFAAYPRGWYYRVQGLPDREVQSAIGEIRYLENHRKAWAAMFGAPLLRYSIASSLLWWVRDSALLAGISRAAARCTRNWPRSGVGVRCSSTGCAGRTASPISTSFSRPSTCADPSL